MSGEEKGGEGRAGRGEERREEVLAVIARPLE
jgi:hypothetical protein